MEEGKLSEVTEGTPQGGVISPLLANIYLHYVFDLWMQSWRKRHARGEVYVMRYADDLWLGPTQGAATVALHFTWAPEQHAVAELLPEVEAALRPFDARPHWGKVFTTDRAELRRVYPRLDDFA